MSQEPPKKKIIPMSACLNDDEKFATALRKAVIEYDVQFINENVKSHKDIFRYIRGQFTRSNHYNPLYIYIFKNNLCGFDDMIKLVNFNTTILSERMDIFETYKYAMEPSTVKGITFLKSMIDAKFSPSFCVSDKVKLCTPLHVAVKQRSVELMKLLLDAKADINQPLCWSWSEEYHHAFRDYDVTPLSFVLRSNTFICTDFTKFLVENGAICRGWGTQVYDNAIITTLESAHMMNDKYVDINRCGADYVIFILKLLIDNKFSINLKGTCGYAPLYPMSLACRNHSIRVINLLLDNNAELDDSITYLINNEYLIREWSDEYIKILKRFKEKKFNFSNVYDFNRSTKYSVIDYFIERYDNLTSGKGGKKTSNNIKCNATCANILKFIYYNSNTICKKFSTSCMNEGIVTTILDYYPRWFEIRLIFAAYYKNKDNQNCLLNRLPLDVIKYMIKLMFERFHERFKKYHDDLLIDKPLPVI